MLQKFVNIFIVATFLSSCSFHISAPKHSVNIAKNVSFKLLDLHILNQNISLQQHLQSSYKGQKYSINLITQISPNKMTVAGLMPIGARIFTMGYDNKKIDLYISKLIPIDQKINRNNLAEYVLADMQLVYFPVDIIRQNITGDVIISNPQNDNLKRVFSKNNVPFIEITYSQENPWQSKIHFQHLERKYEYTIENLQQ